MPSMGKIFDCIKNMIQENIDKHEIIALILKLSNLLITE